MTPRGIAVDEPSMYNPFVDLTQKVTPGNVEGVAEI